MPRFAHSKLCGDLLIAHSILLQSPPSVRSSTPCG